MVISRSQLHVDGISNKPTIRPACYSDLDDIVKIAIAAFRQDPQWTYRFPYATKYSCDHRKFVRLRFVEYFKSVESGVCVMMVAEILNDERPRIKKVVAFSLWQRSGTHGIADGDQKSSIVPPQVYSERRDANNDRVQKFRRVFKTAKREFFDEKYGEDQLYLINIATHPSYTHRGIGTTLIKWGLCKATQEDLTVTLSSSPSAYNLYKNLGFKEVGKACVKVDGELDSVTQPFMAFEPSLHK